MCGHFKGGERIKFLGLELLGLFSSQSLEFMEVESKGQRSV